MERLRTDPFLKVAISRSMKDVMFTNKKSPKDLRLKFCKDVISVVSVAAYARKDFFLIDVINEQISALKSGGLIQVWNDEYVDKTLERESKHPKVLSMKNLSGIFLIWICSCFISGVIFLSEIIYNSCHNVS